MFGEGSTHLSPVWSNQVALRQPRIATTSSLAPIPRSVLNNRASSPSVRP